MNYLCYSARSNLLAPKYYFVYIIVSELAKFLTYSLCHIPFQTVSEHTLKNAGLYLSTKYSNFEWIYLSNFYSNPQLSPGIATQHLKYTLSKIQKPFILCCEPILGSDPRSLTIRNCELTSEERYNKLCKYYINNFKLTEEIMISCTLKTEITGHGKKWSDLERKLMYGIILN
jgi:hypothetical protein